MDDPLGSKSADVSRDAGIGNGAAFQNHPAQMMAPHGFHHGIHILPGGKARAEAHGDGGHFLVSSQVFLGDNGIHHSGSLQSRNCGSGFVHQQWNLPLLPDGVRFLRTGNPHTGQAFHLCTSLPDRFAESRFPADGGRIAAFQCADPEAAAHQPDNHAGGQISRTPHHNPGFFHRVSSFLFIFHCSIKTTTVQPL